MTSEHARKNRRLARAMVDCLNIIGSLMRSYEEGDSHLYIPMAAQLRILFCDTHKRKDHSLLSRLTPDVKLLAFRNIEFQGAGSLQIAALPFKIKTTSNGVILADFELSYPTRFVTLSEWREQVVTLHPCELTVNQIIRSVCDKGGGAHFDDEDGFELSAMRRSGPTLGGIQIPFTIAMARYAHKLGNALIRDRGKHWGISTPNDHRRT